MQDDNISIDQSEFITMNVPSLKHKVDEIWYYTFKILSLLKESINYF